MLADPKKSFFFVFQFSLFRVSVLLQTEKKSLVAKLPSLAVKYEEILC